MTEATGMDSNRDPPPQDEIQALRLRVGELEATEFRLRESEARLQTILSSLYATAVSLFDRDGTCLDVWMGRVVEEYAGFTADEIKGNCVLEILPPEIAGKRLEQIRQVFDTGESIQEEYYRRSWGRGSAGEVTMSPLLGPDGTVQAVVQVTHDVTEREPAEQELARHRDHLEDIVRRCTDELVQANDRLGQEILDRQLAEGAARDSEEKYRALVESAGETICTVDMVGRLLYINVTGAERFGGKPEDFIGKSMLELFPREIAERQLASVQEAIRTRRARIIESETSLQGERRWYRTSIAPMRSSSGRAVAALVIARDTTEFKLAEQARIESEERFRNVLDASRDIVYKLDLQSGAYDYLSPAIKELTGYAPEEIMTEMSVAEVWAFLHPDDLGRVIEEVQRLKDGGSDDEISPLIEYRWRHRDGEFRWFSDNRVLLRDEDGRGLAIVGTVRDITEQKRTEDALRQSEGRYRRLVENAPDIVWTFSDKQGTLYVSSPVASILGYSPDYLYEHPWLLHESVHPDDHGHVCRAIVDFEAGKGLDVEYRIQDARGDWHWLHDRSIGRRASDGETIIEGISTDITERKRAERALQVAHHKLLNAREEQRRHMARELHDTAGQRAVAIQYAVQTVLASAEDSLDDGLRRQLTKVSHNCSEMVRELRRVSHGLYPPTLESLGLVAALRQLARDSDGHAKVTVSCARDLGARRFDPSVEIALFRIAQEALNNAQRHSKSDRVGLRLQLRDDRLHLVVRDDGAGFRPEDAEGRGLGLTTMRERAQAVGGELQIDSRKGNTRVHVAVPLELPKEKLVPKRPSAKASKKAAKTSKKPPRGASGRSSRRKK